MIRRRFDKSPGKIRRQLDHVRLYVVLLLILVTAKLIAWPLASWLWWLIGAATIVVTPFGAPAALEKLRSEMFSIRRKNRIARTWIDDLLKYSHHLAHGVFRLVMTRIVSGMPSSVVQGALTLAVMAGLALAPDPLSLTQETIDLKVCKADDPTTLAVDKWTANQASPLPEPPQQAESPKVAEAAYRLPAPQCRLPEKQPGGCEPFACSFVTSKKTNEPLEYFAARLYTGLVTPSDVRFSIETGEGNVVFADVAYDRELVLESRTPVRLVFAARDDGQVRTHAFHAYFSLAYVWLGQQRTELRPVVRLFKQSTVLSLCQPYRWWCKLEPFPVQY